MSSASVLTLSPAGYCPQLTLRLAAISESEPLCDWRLTANQFVLAPSPLRLMIRYFFFALGPDRVENTARCCISNVAMETCLFAKPLLSNGCRLLAYSSGVYATI
jgi:hypothetical protein